MLEKIYFEAKAKKASTPIEKVIKDLGIVYPNKSLGFLHAVYAKADGKSPNKNGVILAQSVKADVPKLKFTQVNMNHNRAWYVMGSILDAWVNPKTEEIEIVFSFFKSVYPREWNIVEKAVSDGDLNVSFELTVEKSNVETVQGKYRKVNRCNFDGVGLLFPGVKPAYSNARVLLSANEIVSKIFTNTHETIFASAKDVTDKMEEITNEFLKSNKEEIQVDKKAKQALLEKFKADLIAEKGDEVKDWTDEQFEAELEKQAKPEDEDTPVEKSDENKEENSAEEKKEDVETPKAEENHVEAEKKELQEEAEINKTKTTINTVYEVTEDTSTGTMEIVETTTTQREDNGKVTKDEKIVRNTVYTQAKVNEIKADYEAKIAEKDSIIASKDEQIELVKKHASTIASLRAELGEYAQELSDEDLINNIDKVEIARLKKENAELKAGKTTTVETASVDEEADEELQGKDENSNLTEEESEDLVAELVKENHENRNKRTK